MPARLARNEPAAVLERQLFDMTVTGKLAAQFLRDRGPLMPRRLAGFRGVSVYLTAPAVLLLLETLARHGIHVLTEQCAAVADLCEEIAHTRADEVSRHDVPLIGRWEGPANRLVIDVRTGAQQ